MARKIRKRVAKAKSKKDKEYVPAESSEDDSKASKSSKNTSKTKESISSDDEEKIKGMTRRQKLAYFAKKKNIKTKSKSLRKTDGCESFFDSESKPANPDEYTFYSLKHTKVSPKTRLNLKKRPKTSQELTEENALELQKIVEHMSKKYMSKEPKASKPSGPPFKIPIQADLIPKAVIKEEVITFKQSVVGGTPCAKILGPVNLNCSGPIRKNLTENKCLICLGKGLYKVKQKDSIVGICGVQCFKKL